MAKWAARSPLITTTDGVPFATHLPVLHQPPPETAGVLVGHVARANPRIIEDEAWLEKLLDEMVSSA